MKKTYLKSIVLPITAVGLCLSILTSAIQVPKAPIWTEVGGISFRTDSIVALQAHETREDNSLILTDGGWEFEVPVPYLRLKESLGQ